jgi:mono/diheme cytochrome c family protein
MLTNRRLISSALACLFLAACFPKAGTVPGPLSAGAIQSAQAKWPGTSAEEFEQGRLLFLDHCNACHSYPDRTAYKEADWPGIARRMGRKGDLKEAESELVLRFILANRSDPGAAPAASGTP